MKKVPAYVLKYTRGTLYVILSLVVALLVFSQTSLFRSILKDELTSILNNTFRGKVTIGSIDGTLVTSLIVHDIRVADSANTEIATIKRIEVYPKLLEFFRNRINVDKIVIDGMTADLVTDSNGVLNIVKILPKPSEKKEADTVSKPFPYLIKAGTFEFTNSRLNFRKWNFTDTSAAYESLNMDDMRVRNIDIKLNDILIDIAKNSYQITFSRFGLEPNLLNTPKLSVEGGIEIEGRSIDINELKLKTAKSDVLLDYHTRELNIFDNFTTDSLEKADFVLTMVATPFHFADLTSVVKGFDLIKGPVELNFEASGNFINTDIKELELKSRQTGLKLAGNILNVMKADRMRISAEITNSTLNPLDIHELMPGLNLKQFLEFPTIKIDSIGFYGSPLNFRGGLGLKSASGNIAGTYAFDFSKPDAFYEADLRTEKLDISKYVKMPMNLTSKIRARGHGFNPSNAEFELDILGDQSLAGNYFFDLFDLKTKGSKGKILLDMKARLGEQSGQITGDLDLSNMERPVYSIASTFNNIKPAEFFGEGMDNSLLSFTLEAEGEGFNPNDMNVTARLDMKDTRIKGDDLGEIEADLRVIATPDMMKDIFITSNLFTISTSGKFDYATLGSNMGIESQRLMADVTKLLKNYYPDFFEDSVQTAAGTNPLTGTASPKITSSDSLAFSFQVKDLGPLRKFLKLRTFDIQGALSGNLVLDSSRVAFNLWNELDLFRLRASDTSGTIVLVGATAQIKVSHPSDDITIGKLNGLIDTRIKKIFMVNKGKTDTLSNTELTMSLEKSILDLERLDINYNDLVKARVALVVDFMKDSLELDMYETKIDYKGYQLENTRNAVLSFSNKFLYIKDFAMGRGDDPVVSMNARLSAESFNASLDFGNLTLQGIMKDIVQKPFNQPVDAKLAFSVDAGGTYADPVIDAHFSVDDLKYQKDDVGRLSFALKYKDRELRPNGYFFTGDDVGNDSLLSITGVIPYDISFSEARFDFINDRATDIRIDAKSFSLDALNGFIPNIQDLQGVFESGIRITGNYPNLVKNGHAEIKHGMFKVSMTNLLYGLKMGLTLRDSTVEVDELLLTNEGKNVDTYGKITGKGSILLSGYEIKSGNISLGGQLTVMDSPRPSKEFPIFGKLVVSTNEDITLNIARNNYFVKASVNLDKTDLTIPPTQSSVANAGDNYIYRYQEYDIRSGLVDTTLMSILEDDRQFSDTSFRGKKDLPFNLEYQFKVTMSKNSKMTMIFSQEANQKLTTYLEGELNYEKIKGFENVQGELKVSEESTLEFLNLKTFAASGKLRFEREIFNPYLEIEANYNSYYVFAGKGSTSSEQPVQVKLKLKGSMDELSTKFAKESDNIAVYVGEDNISNKVPSPQYDKADAVWFILTGKFKSDLTEADKTSAEGQINTIQGTATSLAGSLLGGLLSSYLGDYVKSLEVRAAGNQTKFNLSGQVSDIKYSFGGTTNLFQDFSTATFKFEIPVLKALLLRIERRESITEGSSTGSMINEMGLKYKIEF